MANSNGHHQPVHVQEFQGDIIIVKMHLNDDAGPLDVVQALQYLAADKTTIAIHRIDTVVEADLK